MRLALLMTATILSSAVSAKDVTRPVLSPACRTEIMKLCPVVTDKAARHACMREKRASISQGCQTEIMTVKAARREAKRRGAGQAPTTPSTMGNAMSPN